MSDSNGISSWYGISIDTEAPPVKLEPGESWERLNIDGVGYIRRGRETHFVREAKATVSESMVERVARTIMQVKARRPASSEESYILASDPDFDDLPASGEEGTVDDEITQEAVLRIARAAIEAMREPTHEIFMAGRNFAIGPREADSVRERWKKQIDAALDPSSVEAIDNVR